ncbi:MAG: hypothetical protein JXQ29_02680 [Planctomycetes bacterium]|nr:hypothetical protein [Planctomycetota bacterium]
MITMPRRWSGAATLALAVVFLAGIPANLAVPLAAQAGEEPPRATTNATVAFVVPTETGATASPATTVLVAARPGKTPLVNGNVKPGEVDGRYACPPGSSAIGIVQYYRRLLREAGWSEVTEFSVSGGVLILLGVTELAAGATGAEIQVNGTTDSKAAAFVAIAADRIVPLDAGTAERAPPAATNATIAFVVPTESGMTTGRFAAVLAVAKPGKTPLVSGAARPGEVGGRHNFPEGANAGAIAVYYAMLLCHAGWEEGTDFAVHGSVLRLLGVTALAQGATNGQVRLNGATESPPVARGATPPAMTLRLERRGAKQDGTITLVAFAAGHEEATSATSTSEVTVPFLGTDRAVDVLAKIREGLEEQGWTAILNGGVLEIRRNAEGDPVRALWRSVEYLGGGRNDDLWTLLER